MRTIRSAAAPRASSGRTGQRCHGRLHRKRCVGVRAEFTAVFLGWQPDPWNPAARWRDFARFDNGVEIGLRTANWSAEPVSGPAEASADGPVWPRWNPETIC